MLGRKISIGPEKSGTRVLARELLARNGIDEHTAQLLALTLHEASEKLLGGEIDVAILLSSWDSPVVKRLLSSSNIELAGFPLGIFEEVQYDEWGVTLDVGDMLVFHSDGIAETANSEGQFFGTTRLRRLIEQYHERTSAELADQILREVDWFASSAPLSDDRTLVILKVK